MRYHLITLATILFFGPGQIGLLAQKNLLVSGGNATANGHGSISYSVGQVFYTICSGDSGTMAHGVQQPYEISVISGVEDNMGISLKVSAYPIPTTDFLTLKVEYLDPSNLSFQLYDQYGNLLESNSITTIETSIKMGNLPSAVYYLKIVPLDLSQHKIMTFKVVKK